MGRTAEGHRQIVWRMALYLEGKDNRYQEYSPSRRQLRMSNDVKYIGYLEVDIADIPRPVCMERSMNLQ
jgi:hypothetical protein